MSSVSIWRTGRHETTDPVFEARRKLGVLHGCLPKMRLNVAVNLILGNEIILGANLFKPEPRATHDCNLDNQWRETGRHPNDL
jgi:hypothetical protein